MSVVPEKLVRLSAEFTMNLLVVLPTISVPLLVKLPAVVKMFPLVTWKTPVAPLVAKFARPTLTPV